MSILHTVNSSPLQTLALQQCLTLLGDHDSLLLIEDGVIATHALHPYLETLQQLASQGRLMVLGPDLQARGIDNEIGKKCSYADFVNLVINHKSQMTW